jgi:hypothetical protein
METFPTDNKSDDLTFTVDENGRKHYILRAEPGVYKISGSDLFNPENINRISALPEIYHEFVSTPGELGDEPPPLLLRLASFVLDPKNHDAALGDLSERFARRTSKSGRLSATLDLIRISS